MNTNEITNTLVYSITCTACYTIKKSRRVGSW